MYQCYIQCIFHGIILERFYVFTQEASEDEKNCAIATSTGFKLKGQTYAPGDFVYVDSEIWKPLVEPKRQKVPEYACKGGRGHKVRGCTS